MKIQDLITYIESLVNFTYYPFAFPKTAGDAVAVVKLSAGMPEDEDTGVSRPNFQVLIRGAARDFENTENKAYEIFDALANKHNQVIGTSSVVAIRPIGSVPDFIGLDENERPIYSLNFTTVIRP